jgi:hypothetical protein
MDHSINDPGCQKSRENMGERREKATGYLDGLCLYPVASVVHPLLDDARCDKEQHFLRATRYGIPAEKIADDRQRAEPGNLVLLG